MAFAYGQNINVYGGAFADISGDHNYVENVSNVSICWNVSNVSISESEPGLLPLFNVTSSGAAFNSHERYPPAKCHPGTREDLIEEVTKWIDRKTIGQDDRVLWLHGPAGAGKSAIAQTIAENSAECKILAASFFFSRGRPGRDSLDRLFTTIAYQLAISIPNLRPAIQQVLIDDPSIVHQVITVQIQKLIIEPLELLTSLKNVKVPTKPTFPFLIIIDGLDECSGTDDQSQILNHILTLVSLPRFPLRLLIVSRPEYNIRNAFEKSPLFEFASGPISIYGDYRSRQDVRVYLLHEFARIYTSDRHEPWMTLVSKPWPSDPIVDVLVKRSDGYFIYAATLVRFVDQEYLSPVEQLNIVLNSSPLNRNAFGELDRLYHQVLATHPDTKTVKVVLRAILSGVELECIAELFGLQPGQVSIIRRALLCLINMEDKKHSIGYPIHKSFFDFIFDPARSGNFHIDPKAMQAQTTRAMLDCLRRYSLACGGSSLIDKSTAALSRAACTSFDDWINHLQLAGPYEDALIQDIMDVDPAIWILQPPQPEMDLSCSRKSGLDFLMEPYEHSIAMFLAIDYRLQVRSNYRSNRPGYEGLLRHFDSLRQTAFKNLLALLAPLGIRGQWIPGTLAHLHTDSLHRVGNGHPADMVMLTHKLLRLPDLEDPLPRRHHSLLLIYGNMFSEVFPDMKPFLDYLQVHVPGDTPWQLLFDIQLANAHLAYCCMSLLTTRVENALATASFGEYQYARRYWAEHLSVAAPDASLLTQLQSIDRRYFFNTEYFSDTMTHLEELEHRWILLFSGDYQEWGQQNDGEICDQTILALSTFTRWNVKDRLARISPQKALRRIKMMFLTHDADATFLVLDWLKDRVKPPPKDLVEQWETYHDEISVAFDFLRREIRQEGSDEEIEEYGDKGFNGKEWNDRRRRRWNEW
ncbi:hypothetical protein FPV67DRAFT_1669280 [Lyophyllum atratum]|nr:hypothetical protein FPV67DRAFT_1669280 [Lyophyllum atratum]